MARYARFAAALALPCLSLVLTLQSTPLHAELYFRTVEQINGEQRWSPARKYANPDDLAYAPPGAGGAPAEVHAFLAGEITPRDVASAAIMIKLLKDGKQRLAGNAVWFASNGGDIDAGMDLGRMLRKLGVYTLVGTNDQCLSACVFAFMGGERRSVAGRLGIHRPYFPYTLDAPDRQTRFRNLQRALKRYIEEMDFPDSLYEAVMIVPPEAMQMLDAAELKRYYLEGISPSSEDLADAAAARGLNLSMYDYLQRKAGLPPCTLPLAGAGRCNTYPQAAVTVRLGSLTAGIGGTPGATSARGGDSRPSSAAESGPDKPDPSRHLP